MQASRVDGLKVLGPIGFGGCGHVYHAVDERGTALALKLFEGVAVSPSLLAETTSKLGIGGWPDGVLPVVSAEFREVPAFRLMPLMADGDPHKTSGPLKSRSLQHRLDQHPGLDSWKLVKSLAKALSEMHLRHVAHGNLKPGNILFDEQGCLLLTDWALGNMPGIDQLQFTDAVLYQPPEQLRKPEGYLEGAGYRWDVFAFGVISYRLLTGRFPRCHAAFNRVAPPPGETHRDGFVADLSKIAENLESQIQVTWPDAARNSLEKGFRECIDACLELDPNLRPATMGALVRSMDEVERSIEIQQQRDQLIDQSTQAERMAWRAWYGMGAVFGLALVLGAAWYHSAHEASAERARQNEEIDQLKKASAAAEHASDSAQRQISQRHTMLVGEMKESLARLEASREVGDLLFSWAMEKGHRSLPPLDGRELRLRKLERYFEDFLNRTGNTPGLEEERGRVRLQLAEISLAAGDAAAAEKRLAAAIDSRGGMPADRELKLRIGTNSLWLAMVYRSKGDEKAASAFEAARRYLSEVPRNEVDALRLDQLLATLDFHEAKLLSTQGHETLALEQMMRGTQALIRISDQSPDSVVLRSELANCYLSSATILEGSGNVADAREVREMALIQLRKLNAGDPGNLRFRLDLAACLGAISEDAVLSADLAAAESALQEAQALLDSILIEHPAHPEALVKKATQLGLRAGLLRDRGQAAEAMRDCVDAIRMLENLDPVKSGNSLATYRLGLLLWQKGRMVGMEGRHEEEIEGISQARQLLGGLVGKTLPDGPLPEPLGRSMAYLLGDLGHAFHLSNRKEDAIQTFSAALAEWQKLSETRPRNEEYSEGLFWCKQRLDDLK